MGKCTNDFEVLNAPKRKGKKMYLTIKEIADIINVLYHRIFREINNRKILFKNIKIINLGIKRI